MHLTDNRVQLLMNFLTFMSIFLSKMILIFSGPFGDDTSTHVNVTSVHTRRSVVKSLICQKVDVADGAWIVDTRALLEEIMEN